MRILVMGGMHGDETLGIELVKLLKRTPIANVDSVLLNQQAIDANCRFVNQDLNRSFPGDLTSDDYETRRAAEVLAMCDEYDVVFDFHNTMCPDNDCSFVGEGCAPLLFDVASECGVERVVVADYDCLNKYAPNCISIEISFSSKVCDAQYWYSKLAALATRSVLPRATNVMTYRFVYRMTLEDKARLDLPSQNMRAFIPIDPTLARAMGLESPAFPIFVGDGLTPYNYGGLLNKL